MEERERQGGSRVWNDLGRVESERGGGILALSQGQKVKDKKKINR